jgi:hypothetical protein
VGFHQPRCEPQGVDVGRVRARHYRPAARSGRATPTAWIASRSEMPFSRA